MKNEDEALYLRPWEEIVGTCVDAIQEEANTILIIDAIPRARRWKLHIRGLTVKIEDLIGQRE